jgi:hypothetical protein
MRIRLATADRLARLLLVLGLLAGLLVPDGLAPTPA